MKCLKGLKSLQGSEDFYDIYAPQKGGFFKVYRASYGRQKGSGLGGIFGTIARKLLPFLSEKVLPFAKKHILPFAASAAKNVAMDIVHGRDDLKHSLAHNSGDAIKRIVTSSLGQSGSGPPRKRARKSKQTRASKKTKKTKSTAKKKKKRKKKTKIQTRDLSFKRSIFD